MWILGINWRWHDTAAAVVDQHGRICAFAEEERFTRLKHAWDTLPARATDFCLRAAGITWRDLDAVALGWDLAQLKPWTDADREALVAALFGVEAARAKRPELVFVGHHLAHAVSSFYASGFERAGVLVVDGSGELEAISIFTADRDSGLTLERSWPRQYSLGTMYAAVTRTIGLGYLGEGKTMGLAPYGRAVDGVTLPIRDLIADDAATAILPFRSRADATYDDLTDAWMRYLDERFDKVTRQPAELNQDAVAVTIAASAQHTVEEAIRALHAETVCRTGCPEVCLAGGVALNSVANGRLPEPVYVPPFAHDAGVALGAAWSLCPPVELARLASPYLGTKLVPDDVLTELREDGFRIADFDPANVTVLLAEGGIGAVAEGRAEIGPRALGHRSIIALPHPVDAAARINALKGREPWRPLAPVTLPAYARKFWPSQGSRELYMVGNAVASSRAYDAMPAAIHVDGTTRPQVLESGQAPVLESLLWDLEEAGAPPVLVNTSFNGPGEPIVDSARDAVGTFRTLGLEFLVLGESLVQPPREKSTIDRANHRP
jgi:carbamoyltransferase